MPCYRPNAVSRYNYWNNFQNKRNICFRGGVSRSLHNQPISNDANKAGMAFDAPQIESIRDEMHILSPPRCV